MKRIITAICSLLLLQCAYGFDKKVLFIKDNVNLREDPNTSCKIEGKLWKGCMLDYISEEDGWTMVVWPDEKDSVAFVSSSLVKVLDCSPVTQETLGRSYNAMGQSCETWHDGTLSFDISRLPYVAVSECWGRTDADGNPISANMSSSIWKFTGNNSADIYTGYNSYKFDDKSISTAKLMAEEEKLKSDETIFYNGEMKILCIPCEFYNAKDNIVNGGMAFVWDGEKGECEGKRLPVNTAR